MSKLPKKPKSYHSKVYRKYKKKFKMAVNVVAKSYYRAGLFESLRTAKAFVIARAKAKAVISTIGWVGEDLAAVERISDNDEQ